MLHILLMKMYSPYIGQIHPSLQGKLTATALVYEKRDAKMGVISELRINFC